MSLKSYGPLTHRPTPLLLKGLGGSKYIVHIEALRTPECQEGVPSPGGQRDYDYDYKSGLVKFSNLDTLLILYIEH